MKPDVVFGLENAGWPALLVDSGGVICRANPMAIRLFGAALEGQSPLLSAIWSPENSSSADEFLARWARSPAATVSLRLLGKGGAMATCQVGVCSFLKDEQRYFVLQVFPEGHGPAHATPNDDTGIWNKQKLDCALQLARTVSLDFNNALTSILGHASLLLSCLEANHPWRSSLIEIEKSAAKAAEIASDLGAFSRQEKEPRTHVAGNLNQLLQHTVECFQQNPGSMPVTWALQWERRLFAAKFDEAKMQQAFLKILENAVQSLEGSGHIAVQTRNIELTQPTQDRNVQLAAGAYVCVEITDNGCGIEPDVLPRIFEPFFTTKRSGGHRGLGLAWVYGIVTNHGGGVAVSSQPGSGTSVRVYLPAERRLVRNEAITAGDLRGNQTILLVDDEDLLLTMGQTILSAYGYRVLTANSGQKALELLAQNKDAVDLVITDLVMPTMGGRELMEHIQQRAPGLRILCTSGYVWPSKLEDDTRYLQKPFTSQELLVKVKTALATDKSNG